MSESIHLLTGAYAVDALDPAERSEFEQHLDGCPECAAEVRELLETTARLASAEVVEPSAGFHARVMAEVDQTRQERPPGAVVPLRPRRASASTWVLGVAAAVLAVVAVGLGVSLVHTKNDQAALTANAQAVSAVISAPDARTVPGEVTGGGRGAVVVSDSVGQAVFVANGLATPPSDHVYELWFIDSAGTATAAGSFTPNKDGVAAVPLSGSPTGAAQVAVTVEPAGGSSQPTTKPVMAVPV